MKMISFLAIAIFLAISPSFAQSLTIIDTGSITRERWRDSLLRIDKNQVPTGFLLEYSQFGLPSNVHDGLGGDDSTITDDGRIFELHSILWHSKVNSNAAITITDTLFSRAFFADLDQQVVPLTFIYQSYNRIRETALSEGLFSIAPDDVGILDVPNRPGSPYDTHQLFAFAPYRTTITRFNSIPFTLPDDLFFVQGYTSIEVDFGDGAGFRTLNKGGVVNIYYATEGVKTLTARLHTPGGTRLAKCAIEYKRPAYYAQPDYSWNISVPAVYADDNQYLGVGSRGTTIFPCGGNFVQQILCNRDPNARIEVENGCDGVFDKPVIILEGFDPENKFGLAELRARFNQSGFLGTLRGYGYDIVFVDFTKNTTYIENNAKVLEAIINMVNTVKVGNASSTIIGFSMGGLIARWCLKDMEDRGLQHHVSNYFSYDTPHQGANIPLGMQYTFAEMAHDLPYLRFNSSFRQLDDAFQSPAGRQMLVTYAEYNSGGISWSPASTPATPLRGAFAQRLQAKGYPQQCANYAIAFGRGNNTLGTKDAGNGIQFTPGNPLNPQTNLFTGAMSFVAVNLNAWAYAVPENNNTATIANYRFMGITFRHIFGVPVWPTVSLRSRRIDYTGQFPYDDAPGGFEMTQTQFKFSWRGGLAGPASTNGHDGHSFLSVASALDLQNQSYGSGNNWQSNNLFYNIDQQIQNPGQVTGNTLATPSLSPFAAVITGTSDCNSTACFAEQYYNSGKEWISPPNSASWNHYHNSSIMPQFARFILRKMVNTQPVNCGGSNGLCNSTASITGPELVCVNGQYQLNNVPNGVRIEWQMQNGFMRIDNGQGTPVINTTKLNDGNEVVKALLTNACGTTLTVTLNVGVGTPPPFLSIAVNCPEITCFALGAAGATSYTWQLDNQFGSIVSPNETSVKNFKAISGDVTVWVKYTNACGTSFNTGQHVYCEPGGHHIVVMPNPTTSQLSASIKPSGSAAARSATPSLIYQAELSDKFGQVKKRMQWKQGLSTISMNVSDLPKDVYILRLYDGKEWFSEKVIVR